MSGSSRDAEKAGGHVADEILDVTEDLFATHGFEKTASAVVNTAGATVQDDLGEVLELLLRGLTRPPPRVATEAQEPNAAPPTSPNSSSHGSCHVE